MSGRIYMSAPDVGSLEQEYVAAAMASGWIAPLGPSVDAFEREFAERTGVPHAVALSSGTAALHLGLLGLGAGPGTVVVTSTMTFAATANAVRYTGARPVFVDSDPVTGNMSAEVLADALETLDAEGARVAAILPVDLLGKVADYDAIEALAGPRRIPVLADAAEAVGASRGGRAAGSFGVAAALSFNGNKVLTTSGGGMLLTRDAALAARARTLATQARLPTVHYEHAEIGYNYRLSNLLAALGRAQLARLDAMIARRREIREFYRDAVAELDGVEIFDGGDDSDDNCWLTSILVDPARAGWTSAELGEVMRAQDIECRPLWKPMHLQPVFREERAFVNGAAEALFRAGLTLPSGSALTDTELARVAAALDEFARSRR